MLAINSAFFLEQCHFSSKVSYIQHTVIVVQCSLMPRIDILYIFHVAEDCQVVYFIQQLCLPSTVKFTYNFICTTSQLLQKREMTCVFPQNIKLTNLESNNCILLQIHNAESSFHLQECALISRCDGPGHRYITIDTFSPGHYYLKLTIVVRVTLTWFT